MPSTMYPAARSSLERASLSRVMTSSVEFREHEHRQDAFTKMETPDEAGKAKKVDHGDDDGALTAGGVPDLYTKESFGLLVNYMSVGLVMGLFPSTVYPFLRNYLHLEGYQAEAARVLVSMPWSFKTFIGIITDSFPIGGYKRRPYMVLGWSFCVLLLLIMTFMPVGDAYYVKGHLHLSNETLRQVQNPNAPNEGGKYIVMMMLAALGYVVADVAADGMTVEYAMREPEAIRGKTQTTIYLTRTLASIVAVAISGFAFNGKEYGGDFDFSLTFNMVMLICAIGCSVAIPASIFLLAEKKVERESFSLRCREMWRIAQQRAIWQVMAFNFFNSLFWGFSYTPSYVIQQEWAKVRPLTNNIFEVVGYGVFAFSLWLTKTYFLNANWRYMILITSISVICIDAIVVSFTVFDVLRSQWFWLGVPIVETLPEGVRFIVGTYVTVEIAEEGYESATYGLITTVHNLASPFAASLYKVIDAQFDVTSEDIEKDTDHVRMHVMYTVLIMYGMKLASNFFLPLLPPQKREAQALKHQGGSSASIGGIAFLIAGFALLWSVSTNLLSVFPSTKCLRIAGGQGC